MKNLRFCVEFSLESTIIFLFAACLILIFSPRELVIPLLIADIIFYPIRFVSVKDPKKIDYVEKNENK